MKNGTANYAGLPSGLSEMNGALSFTRDRIHIDQLTARTGGGTLDLKGDVTNYNRQINFNLTAVGKEVRLRYPPGVSSTATAELHWVGTPRCFGGFRRCLGHEIGRNPGLRFRFLSGAQPAVGCNHAGKFAAVQREARRGRSHRA